MKGNPNIELLKFVNFLPGKDDIKNEIEWNGIEPTIN